MTAPYPPELKARIMDLKHQGLNSVEIAAHTGLTARQVRSAWRTPEQRQRRLAKLYARRRLLRRSPATNGIAMQRRDPRDVPPSVLADRDRRIEAEMTPNMAVLGDPVVPRWNSNA